MTTDSKTPSVTTVGQVLLNEVLPEDLRNYQRVLDKKSIADLFREIQQRYPDKYVSILQEFMRLGADFASTKGLSVSLRHTKRGPRAEQLIQKLKAENEKDIRDTKLTDDEKEERILQRLKEYYPLIEQAALEDQKDMQSPYYIQYASGGRGNPTQINQMSGAELVVADHQNRFIPIPIYSSYSDGLSPVEYWGSVYGTRRGIVSTKFSVAAGGFLGKQLALAAHRFVVTKDKPHPTRLPVGIPAHIDEADLAGSVLAMDAGPYKAGTILTPKILADLKSKNIERVLVHSPLTAIDEDGGIDAWSAGVRERGTLPAIGDNVGITAAQAISEPITQSMLCLAEHTLIETKERGIIPINHVQIGFHVRSLDSRNRVHWTRVVRVYCNGSLPCYTYGIYISPDSISHLGTLECTKTHKVAVVSKNNKPYELVEIGLLTPHQPVFAYIDNKLTKVYIRQETQEPKIYFVYDLEVCSKNHTFFVYEGALVSNSEKHTAGGGKVKSKMSGFDIINKMLQAPETFSDVAPLAPEDGVIQDIQKAPQGGHYVILNNKRIYIYPNHEIIVKPGQRVWTGDDLTAGIPHPIDLVRYRGVGEARRVYSQHLRNILKESGVNAHRRNVDAVVAGLINHIKITNPEGLGDHIVDDIVPYNRFAATYTPRPGAVRVSPKKALGKYLEEPVLHYSVGTRITPPIVKELESWGISDIYAHDEHPGFDGEWERLMTTVSHDPDWQTRLGGFYIGQSFIDAVHRGLKSETPSTSYFPSLAKGVGFGKSLTQTGKY